MAGQSTTRREPPAPAKPRRRTRAAKAETQGDGAPAAKARARKASAKSSAPGRAAGAPARKSATAKRTGTTPAQEKSPRKAAAPARKPARPLSEAERASRFRMLLHTTCLKAGSAAAATAIATRVPLLNRVAPMLVGARLEAMSVPRIQQQLVEDVIDLYGISLSEQERQGVVLLATAANVGAGELSRRTVQDLVDRIGAPLGRPLLDRMLPLTQLVGENAAAIASTYAVGRRAQALCRLSGSGARDLGELLGTITGIDQRQLLEWSTEAAKLALKPFRAAVAGLRLRR